MFDNAKLSTNDEELDDYRDFDDEHSQRGSKLDDLGVDEDEEDAEEAPAGAPLPLAGDVPAPAAPAQSAPPKPPAKKAAAKKAPARKAAAAAPAKKAAVKVAQLELARAQTVLEMYTIRSPVSGVVRAIRKHRGEAVRKLETVFEIEITVRD